MIGVTIVNDKMLDLALEQKENFKKFGIEHVIVHEEANYSTNFWLKRVDITRNAILEYGKVLRVDAEIRLHRPIPEEWVENCVLFEPYPLIKNPWYVAMQGGQVILDKSALQFLYLLKECMIGAIPPDGDATQWVMSQNHYIDDEPYASIASRIAQFKYYKEQINRNRISNVSYRANRGSWVDNNTVLTHPGIHNWCWLGAGMNRNFDEVSLIQFINHYDDEAEKGLIIAHMLIHGASEFAWNKHCEKISDDLFKSGNWVFNPIDKTCAPVTFYQEKMKTLVHSALN